MIQTLNRTRTFKTLLSYAPADRELGEELKRILSKRDDIDLLTREIREDEKWQKKTEVELQTRNLFVVVLSPDALQSDWIRLQLGFFCGYGRMIIPVNTQPNVEIPIQHDGLVSFQKEKVLIPENWARILDACEESGLLEGRWFTFLTKNPLE